MFAPKVDYTVGNSPIYVASGDLDGDGKPDVVTANNNGSNITVYINNRDGTFTKNTYVTGNIPYSIAIGDVNGDGKNDVVVANFGSNSVSVLLNNGYGLFDTQTVYHSIPNPSSVTLGYLNGNKNGNKDMVVTSSDHHVYTFLNKNDGTGIFSDGIGYTYTTNGNGGTVVVGNLSNNNDNFKNDIAVLNNDKISVLLNNGDGTFAQHVSYPTGSLSKSVTVGDFDGRNGPDLAVTNSGHIVSILLNNGDGTFASKIDYSTGATSYPTSVAIADVNNDSKPDLIVSTIIGSSGNVLVFLKNGDGTFAQPITYTTDTFSEDVTVSDVNGDGKPDIITANDATSGNGTISVLLNNGDGTFAQYVSYPTGGGGIYGIASGDLNGDGKPDLVVVGAYSIHILLNN